MEKKNGKLSDFALMRTEGTQIIIGYGLNNIEGTEMYEWLEVCIPKKQTNLVTLQMVKDAIIKDINDRTDAKILNGYQWTVLHGADTGRTVNVWLSAENKENYKAKYDTAKDDPELITWPTKFKVSENEDKTPVYEYFANVNELKAFYYGGLAFIETAVNEGWAEKDGIDWEPYETLFQVKNEVE